MQKLSDSLDIGETIDAAVFDFSKAFDVVPSNKLRTKMLNLGIEHVLVNWILSYLTDRTQQVSLGNCLSESADVTSGIIQGSTLGPTLFNIYINDLPIKLNSSSNFYADDFIMHKVIQTDLDRALFQIDLDLAHKWSIDWGIQFNYDKCNVITFTKKRKGRVSLGVDLAILG